MKGFRYGIWNYSYNHLPLYSPPRLLPRLLPSPPHPKRQRKNARHERMIGAERERIDEIETDLYVLVGEGGGVYIYLLYIQ